ncbi:MAG: hypothetical protein WDM91_22685 [Rhizomicrobium sp.]
MGSRLFKPQSAKIFVSLSAEPGTLARVLQIFTVAGLVPAALTLRSRSAGKSLFVAEFPGLEPAKARFLIAKLSGMPCVRRARMSIAKDRIGAGGVGCAG